MDRQKFRIILPLCTLDIAPPHQPPSTKVSGDTNVNTSDIAPCLAALIECGSVGWDFYLARQHGSASVVCQEAFVFSTLQNSPVDCSSGLLCAPRRHNTGFLSPHTARFKLSALDCSDNNTRIKKNTFKRTQLTN